MFFFQLSLSFLLHGIPLKGALHLHLLSLDKEVKVGLSGRDQHCLDERHMNGDADANMIKEICW